MHAVDRPGARAYVTPQDEVSWQEYDVRARALAEKLMRVGACEGDRIAVLLPDGAAVHIAFLAVELMGGVIVGVGARAGMRELEHLLGLTGASCLLSAFEYQHQPTPRVFENLNKAGLALRHHIVIDPVSGEVADENDVKRGQLARFPAARAIDAPFLLNSTSGTTGMPKCVIHDQARWFGFHDFAVEAGALSKDDVFMSVVPAPFGFGIWTAHVTPTLLGVTTVLLPVFDADAAIELIQHQRVSVLAAVSTQFIMMLESQSMKHADFSSLRVLFTGGEAVPRERAEAFEARTGASVLQFYGSNETGAVSRTTLDDTRERRHATAGRVIEAMNVRLFDEAGHDVTATGRGQPGCKGATLSQGYYANPEANRKLVRDDGWMMLGDIVEIDDEGYLTVVGRKEDFIIRGGKNISAVAVEEQVGAHPAVAHVGVVAAPDRVFGERICACVELRPGETLDLEDLRAFLRARDVSKEYLPEHLVPFDALPRSAGGKVAKGELRKRVRSRFPIAD